MLGIEVLLGLLEALAGAESALHGVSLCRLFEEAGTHGVDIIAAHGGVSFLVAG